MSEEKREYSVIGTVTIGTDEYRDLMEDKFKAEHEKDYYMREVWKKDDEIKNLRKQIESLSGEIDKLKKFIKKNSVNIGEDGITLVMQMLGEE